MPFKDFQHASFHHRKYNLRYFKTRINRETNGVVLCLMQIIITPLGKTNNFRNLNMFPNITVNKGNHKKNHLLKLLRVIFTLHARKVVPRMTVWITFWHSVSIFEGVNEEIIRNNYP